MFTVKFMKFGPHSTDRPTFTEGVMVREATAVHFEFKEGQRTIVQLGDAPGDTFEVEISPNGPYHKAYVMNEDGRTVETIP